VNQAAVVSQDSQLGSAEAVQQPANGKIENPVSNVTEAQTNVSGNVEQHIVPRPTVRHSVPKNPAPEPTKRISASKYAEANKQRTKERGSANATRSTQTSIPVQSRISCGGFEHTAIRP